MIKSVLIAITRRVPVCSLCNGDDHYVKIVAEAFMLVPSTLWPDLDSVFEDNFSHQQKHYRKLLTDILGQYPKPRPAK
jgi:hypothetical protein